MKEPTTNLAALNKHSSSSHSSASPLQLATATTDSTAATGQHSIFSVSNDPPRDISERYDYTAISQPRAICNFSGSKTESISDWLRQFKSFTKLYRMYNENNLQLFASSFLTGEAGKFYDNLLKEPETWTEFQDVMNKRYAKTTYDSTTLLKKVLNRTMKHDEDLMEFCNELYGLGQKAGMEEVNILQVIMSNMYHPNKALIRVAMKSQGKTYRDLLSVLELIDDSREEDEADKYPLFTQAKPQTPINNTEISSLIDRIENLTLAISKSSNNHSQIRHALIKCSYCNRNGHISEECRKLKIT
jgi:hypothetical protein